MMVLAAAATPLLNPAIWFAYVDDFPALTALPPFPLPPRIASIRHPLRRSQSILARYLLRCALTTEFDVVPSDPQDLSAFSGAGTQGDPAGSFCIRTRSTDTVGEDAFEVCTRQGWCAGVAHSGNLVGVAWSKGPWVGIDVEDIRRKVRFDAIAERFFPRPLARYVQGVDIPQKRRRFFLVWTLREALIKAAARCMPVPFTGMPDFGISAETWATLLTAGEAEHAFRVKLPCRLPYAASDARDSFLQVYFFTVRTDYQVCFVQSVGEVFTAFRVVEMTTADQTLIYSPLCRDVGV